RRLAAFSLRHALSKCAPPLRPCDACVSHSETNLTSYGGPPRVYARAMTEGRGFSWGAVLGKLLAGHALDEGEAGAAMAETMEGAATPAQIAGFVIALRSKGETADELVGLVTPTPACGQRAGGQGAL